MSNKRNNNINVIIRLFEMEKDFLVELNKIYSYPVVFNDENCCIVVVAV